MSEGARTAIRRGVAGSLVVALALVAWLGRRAGGVEADEGDLGFSLRDVAGEAGVEFRHRGPTLDPKLDPIAPHVAALGASVSVADPNRDGWPELYFTNSRFGHPNALFLNRTDGTFERAAAAVGVADLNREGEGVSMGAVWGDYDNDGREDLFVYKWGYLQLLRNEADGEALRFRDVTEGAGLRRWMNANSAVWFDYDRDGFLDLYVAGYFRSEVDMWDLETTRIMHDSFEFSNNGGNNLLFRNLGDGRFEDVTDAMGVGSTRWTMAVAAADFDDDGWPDLYLANDYGPEELYLNTRGKAFGLAPAGLRDDSKSGMSVTVGDVRGSGLLDVFVTNISERGYLFQGNNLRINRLRDAERFDEVARGAVADAGWAWGAQFGDLNNDGLLDLFVTNGFISADPERSYWYAMSKIAGGARHIFEDAANWPPIGDASLSGYERSRVLLGQGEGRLLDVAVAVGVEDRYDGRAVALVDLWNRGALDAVVANQNGPALVYRNEPDPGRHWVGFRLEATRSNRSAIGVDVTLELPDGRRMRKVVDGGVGFASQNDRRLHFGLGDLDRVPRATVRWPSGAVQTVEGLVADRYHVLREPEEAPTRGG